MKPIRECVEEIRRLAGRIKRPVRLMEVCGSHTTAAYRTGIRSLLPENVSLISGPGCPVCVSTDRFVDQAVALAGMRNVTVAAFGDMIRVPGTRSSLEQARAEGAEVRVVYSQSDALEEAVTRPSRTIIFLGVGFETTAPATAWTIRRAAESGILNFKVMSAHKTMPMALRAIVASPELRVDGFLCPGHVSVVTGASIYGFICREFRVPCVVAGFEAADMLESIRMLLDQIERGAAEVGIQYGRSVGREGNEKALAVMNGVFEPSDDEWRGFGVIPGSGLKIRPAFGNHDAAPLLEGMELPLPRADRGCRCGDVIRGAITPAQCPLFGGECTPASPAGACMVSSEGTCAAWYKYDFSKRKGT